MIQAELSFPIGVFNEERELTSHRDSQMSTLNQPEPPKPANNTKVPPVSESHPPQVLTTEPPKVLDKHQEVAQLYQSL